MKIQLQYPIKTPAGEVGEIELRRPKLKDMKRVQEQYPGNDAAQEIALLAAITAQKLTSEDLEELDLADYAEVQSAFRIMVSGQKRHIEGGGAAGAVVSDAT